MAYAEAVERAQGIHVRRAPSTSRHHARGRASALAPAQYWPRIALHEASTPASSSSSASARSMDLAEKLSGHRKTYGLNVIGGVRRDIWPSRAFHAHDHPPAALRGSGARRRLALHAQLY
ncbi:MAG: hypothetical protein ACLRM9_01060 [Collinsella aerofaciens]